MASIGINNVSKAYGATEVIHGVSIDIADGEFVTLVGPSGCGKSTLLRMVAGLEEVTRGQVRIGEKVVHEMLPKDRDVAMVFQNYALYPHMTVRQNMGFSLRLKRAPAKEVAAKVGKAVGILGLESLLERYPRELSGGQRQRVAMGRAIVRDPQVFLFDEPLSNLDAKLRVQMRTEIKELHQRLKTTTIYVTHDQIEAMTMADKIVVMRDGVVEQAGSPLDLYDMPRNRFVASFIGSPGMNFITGEIEHNQFKSASGQLLPLPSNESQWDYRRLVYGIRPEHFFLDDSQGIAAEVIVVEPTGADTQVSFKLGADIVVGIFRDRVLAAPGSKIRLRPDPSKVHIFDAETGASLQHGGTPAA